MPILTPACLQASHQQELRTNQPHAFLLVTQDQGTISTDQHDEGLQFHFPFWLHGPKLSCYPKFQSPWDMHKLCTSKQGSDVVKALALG